MAVLPGINHGGRTKPVLQRRRKRSQVVLERTSSIAIGCDRTSNLPATRSPERLKAANLRFFTLYLFATEADKFGPLEACVFVAKLILTGELLGTHTAIGTHRR